MIGYYTDNTVSQGVMKAFAQSGIEVRHISQFEAGPSIFYGILRGSGVAMRFLELLGIDYWYLDNGYFDAIYLDEFKIKDMSGKYRVVKNGLIEPVCPYNLNLKVSKPSKVMLLPPTPYTAFMHDTTPEDWNMEWHHRLKEMGHELLVREKNTKVPLAESLNHVDAVLAFNSMAIMKAIEMGKAVYTTHGCVRNTELFYSHLPYYDLEELKSIYEPKQFTLEEIKDRGVECLN